MSKPSPDSNLVPDQNLDMKKTLDLVWTSTDDGHQPVSVRGSITLFDFLIVKTWLICGHFVLGIEIDYIFNERSGVLSFKAIVPFNMNNRIFFPDIFDF